LSPQDRQRIDDKDLLEVEAAMTPSDVSDEFDRRAALRYLAALGLLLTPVGGLAGCGDGGLPMMGDDGMMDPAMMGDMATIHQLLTRHDKITRTVEDVDRGIRSVTTSSDPQLASAIATHVAAMRARLEGDHPIRQGDPLFREIFKHHAQITVKVEPVPGGVQVTETSTDAQVVLLIRQHARAAVSQFVAQGMSRAMQPTPLPAGYHA
jgi:hypothetical protein